MNEVLITSSSGDAVVSANVWDSKTCANLMSYRGGGIINPKGLGLLGSDYLIGVEKSKPLLQIWSINSQQPLNSPRLLCPGKISVMSCSPDGYYIVVGVEEKFHVYQVSSGCLIGSGVRHFQPIKVIRWSHGGDILACGGEDGMVTVWSLSSLLNKESQKIASDPRYIFSDHSLPVTDLIFTCGGSSCYRSRLISVSSDRTCKIHDLGTGKILLSVIFVEMLTSVSISPSEMEIFVGCTSGDIDEFSLRTPKNVSSPEIHISAGILSGNKDVMNVYSGHEKSVTCLSVSIDGERLLSGSLDESVRIWHIVSKQCLKILNLKGPVTNAFFMNAPKQMFEQDVKRNIMLRPFQKTQSLSDEGIEYSLDIINYNDLDISCYDPLRYECENIFRNRSSVFNGSGYDISMKDEINRLRNVNEKLYKISVQSLLQKRVNDNLNDSCYSNEEKSVSVDNEKNDIIENIFDKMISYQQQPNLKNKKKKKHSMKRKGQETEDDCSRMQSKLNLRKMKKQDRKKKESKKN